MSVDLAAYQDRCEAKVPAPEVKPPAPKATTFKHLDGARLRAAWEKQGVVIKPGGKLGPAAGD
jgi:hypothetical protein